MKNHRDPVAALAARQHGVVTGRQLEELGVPDAAVERLRPVYPGVYAVGEGTLTREGRGTAAVFATLLELGSPAG